MWTQITADAQAGLAYLPVESPTSDYYGGERPGNNLFGESLVCVELKTGKMKWYYQIVHHPVWDYGDMVVGAPVGRCCRWMASRVK